MSSRGRAGLAVRRALLVVGAAAVVGPSADLGAQDLEARVRGLEGGGAFRLPLRREVEVCERGIRVGEENRVRWEWRHDGEADERRCSSGLAEVLVTVRGGVVRTLDVEPWEGRGSTPSGSVDLGRAPAPEAEAFLMSVAGSRRDAEDAAREAVMVVTLLEGVEVWPGLLDVARDRGVDADVRRSAVFWLGQAAADAATDGLADLAGDEDEDQDVRDAAVFALSQRPDDEALPVLMELARTAERARTRRKAMFWLAQSRDERVLEFFESILVSGRPGGW